MDIFADLVRGINCGSTFESQICKRVVLLNFFSFCFFSICPICESVSCRTNQTNRFYRVRFLFFIWSILVGLYFGTWHKISGMYPIEDTAVDSCRIYGVRYSSFKLAMIKLRNFTCCVYFLCNVAFWFHKLWVCTFFCLVYYSLINFFQCDGWKLVINSMKYATVHQICTVTFSLFKIEPKCLSFYERGSFRILYAPRVISVI